MKVLVVSDDVSAVGRLAAGIAEGGHDVAKATSAAVASELLARNTDARVVVVDGGGTDGLELCRRIRESSDTYVLLVTEDSGRERLAAAMAAGADDFVSKPIDFGVVIARLRIAERITLMEAELQRLHQAARRTLHGGAPASEPEPAVAEPRKPTVVLIDDSEALLVMTQAVLEEAGFAVRTCATGEEGLDELIAEPPDVALVDVSLPDLSGDQIVERAKRRPELAGVQFLLYSGRETAELEALARSCGASGFVRKTVRPEDLVAKVSSLVVRPGDEAPAAGPPAALAPKVHALRHALWALASGATGDAPRRDAYLLARKLSRAATAIGAGPIGGWATAIESELRDADGVLSESAWERIDRALEGLGLRAVMPSAAPPPRIAVARPCVLVLDTKPQAQLIAKELGDRFEVIVPDNTVETLQRAQRANAIVADADQPDLRALGLLAALRRRGGAAQVIVCAQHEESTYFKAVPLGAIAVLAKPVRLGTIAATLDLALQQEARALALGLTRNHLDGLREVFAVSAGKATRSLAHRTRQEAKVTAARTIAASHDELLAILTMGIGGPVATIRSDVTGAISATARVMLAGGLPSREACEIGETIVESLLGSFLRSLSLRCRIAEPVVERELAPAGDHPAQCLVLEALFEARGKVGAAKFGKATIVLGCASLPAIVAELGRMLA